MKRVKPKHRKINFVIIFLFSLILLFILSYLLVYYNITTNPKILPEINVNEEVKQDEFNFMLFDKKYPAYIVENTLNVNKIGTYTVDYNTKIMGLKFKKKISRTVVDKINPEIKLNGDELIRLYLNDEYEELGAIAIDNYDGDISSNIKIEGSVDTKREGIYDVVYKISDSSGNTNSITRKVHVIYRASKPNNEIKLTSTSSIKPDKEGKFIIDYIKENNLNVSVGYVNLLSNKEFYYDEKKIYYGASLIKTVDALYLYDNDMIDADIENRISKAITYSDNKEHLFLVDYIGKNNLANYGHSLGAKYTLSGGDKFGYTNVCDQIVYYKKVYEQIETNKNLRTYLSTSICNYIKRSNIETLCKYGYWNEVFHNSGIVLDKEPYILVILTSHGFDNYDEIISNISDLVSIYHNMQNQE